MIAMKILDREISAWLAVVAAVFQVVTSYGFDVDGELQGMITAGVVFVFAVAVAIKAGDGIIALVTGIAVALSSLFAAFGLNWSAETQTLWVGLATVIVGLFVRTQVVAPVGPDVSPPGKLVV
jgi:uncharacterized membrane protein